MIKDFIAGSFLQYQPGADDTSPDHQPGADEPTLTTALPSVDDRKYGHDSISQYSLKTVDETMVASLHSLLTEKAVIEGPLTVEDNLANILSGHPVKDHFNRESLPVFECIAHEGG